MHRELRGKKNVALQLLHLEYREQHPMFCSSEPAWPASPHAAAPCAYWEALTEAPVRFAQKDLRPETMP